MVIVPLEKIGLLRRSELTTIVEPRDQGVKCPYRIGGLYTPRRTGVTVEVTGIAQAHVNDVDGQVAERAGYGDAAEFRVDWRTRWLGVQGEPSGEPLHVDEPVWIVWFIVATDVPRIPSRAPGSLKADYTRNRYQAMDDEPEAVFEAVQEEQTKEAHERWERLRPDRDQEWSRLPNNRARAEVERAVKMSGHPGALRDLEKARRLERELVDRARRKLLGDPKEEAA